MTVWMCNVYYVFTCLAFIHWHVNSLTLLERESIIKHLIKLVFSIHRRAFLSIASDAGPPQPSPAYKMLPPLTETVMAGRETVMQFINPHEALNGPICACSSPLSRTCFCSLFHILMDYTYIYISVRVSIYSIFQCWHHQSLLFGFKAGCPFFSPSLDPTNRKGWSSK